jgi:hypothetical protein
LDENLKLYQSESMSSESQEYIVNCDIGCYPSTSGSGEVLMQSDRCTFIIFDANSSALNEQGFSEDLGTAVVECRGCSLTRFGYPNEEGQDDHPLWLKGLRDCDGIGEVINSSWKASLESLMDASARRIWRDRYYKSYNVPEGGQREWKWKHFIFIFHENIFECIADELVLTLSPKPFNQVLADVAANFR